MNDKVTLKKSKVIVAIKHDWQGKEFVPREIDGYKLLVDGVETGLAVHKAYRWNTETDAPDYISKTWAAAAANGLSIGVPPPTSRDKHLATLWAYAIWKEFVGAGAPRTMDVEFFNEYASGRGVTVSLANVIEDYDRMKEAAK